MGHAQLQSRRERKTKEGEIVEENFSIEDGSQFYFNLASDLIVTLPTGRIEGFNAKTSAGKAYRAFQGIPFGKKPTGKLRFQAPEPAEKWLGILKTQKEHNGCYSVGRTLPTDTEDCLYLNVYTPVRNNKTLLPVMFYIHGGGFRGGGASSHVYGPDYLLEEDVIVVETNYRTSAFGFLSTGDTIVPGNAGLKDMILALKWVNQNIGLFGGDPEKVTIFGQSAGGAAVGLLVATNATIGLFRAAIAESGSGVSNWAIQLDPMAYARELAFKITNTTITDSTRLLKVLQTATSASIHIASQEMSYPPDALPVLEVPHAGAVLTKPMYESIVQGDFNKVPLLVGANSEEYISLADNMTSLQSRTELYENNPEILPPPSFNVQDTNKLNEIGLEIHNIYLTNGSKFQDNVGLAIAYRSESHFFNPCFRHAEIQSQHTDVYLYKFSYAGKMGGNKFHHLEGAELCTHGEELNYIFKRAANADLKKFSADDVLTLRRMVKWWTNFAKYLNPTPEVSRLFENVTWPRVDPNHLQYMNIDKHLSIQSDVKHGRYNRWKELYEKYAEAPHITF